MIRMVIFDMAGTTIDENNLVYKCIRKALEFHQYITDLDTVLYHCAGKEKRDAIKTILDEIYKATVSSEMIDQIYDTFQHLLEESYEIAPIELMHGARTVINHLRDSGIKVVFNTGYNEQTAMKILKKVNFLPSVDFDALVTADMVKSARPAPDMIEYALHIFGVSAKECMKVGDSMIDIEEGKNAGVCYTIGITSGAHTRELLLQSQPDDVIDDLVELLQIVKNINSGVN